MDYGNIKSTLRDNYCMELSKSKKYKKLRNDVQLSKRSVPINIIGHFE